MWTVSCLMPVKEKNKTSFIFGSALLLTPLLRMKYTFQKMMPNKQFSIKQQSKPQMYADFVSSHKFGIQFPPIHF